MELGEVGPLRRPRKVGRWIVLALALLGGGGLALRHGVLHCVVVPERWCARSGAARVDRVVPDGTRIKVEVLNATDTRGVARQAMFALRDAGFDVVFYGNTAERLDSTLVLDRAGHAEWAALAARAMRGARVDLRPDSSHFLDLTILVGRNWAPPREPLYP